MSAPARPIEETPLNNLRDLGGIAVEGGVIAPGHLFRSDDVSTVPDEQARELFDRGIRTIIDLRSPAEAEHTGRGPLGRYDVTYRRMSLLRGGAEPDEFLQHLREDSATPRTVGEYYAATLVAEADTLAEGIRAIADAPGGVLFHCAAGKDRTGIFAAALLSVLGADEEDIATDYALSSTAVPRIMARVSASIGHLMGESDAFFRAAAEGRGPVSPLLGAEHDAMVEMLAILDEERGGAAVVLREAGLDDDVVQRLRARVVEG
ncbi:tyrosine-protein phosphatase [Microbacterium sp.]|uniref:tyrosine-protein phosphatase n=1 Tax=Microbacterium sp. TaxID=51671 RepID=UPI002E315773|nr:tyrosine-protein phosphatase [Microbacterium sp.]HEX5731040.1 tyrosine-protein phosphatase [Microbacterium sp.]